MAWFSFLVRMLLGLSLILNGLGSAIASVPMSDRHDATPVTGSAGPGAVVKRQPCHESPGEDATRAGTSNGAAEIALAERVPDPIRLPPSPDCCESGDCSCGCAHHASAAVSTPVLPIAGIEHALVSSAARPRHVSPVLPHLIRPPIG